MALIIRNPDELLKYLQTRKALAERQLRVLEAANPPSVGGKNVKAAGAANARGIVYAFDEAIRAVEALLEGYSPPSPTPALPPGPDSKT